MDTFHCSVQDQFESRSEIIWILWLWSVLLVCEYWVSSHTTLCYCAVYKLKRSAHSGKSFK